MIKFYIEKQCLFQEEDVNTYKIRAENKKVNITIWECKHKQNAELIAKILNDDKNGVSSVVKAWEQYRGIDVV